MQRLLYLFFMCTIISFAQAQSQSSKKPVHQILQSIPLLQTIKLSNGVELEYAEQGNKNGIPVILLHGFTDSWKSYEDVLANLPTSFHVFSISQRGHGNSSKEPRNYHPQDFADDVAAFIKQKKLASAVIVGHSMGSTNAQCFATKYPSMAKALVLVASFADYQKAMIDDFKKLIDELQDPVDSNFVVEFQKSTITKPIGDEKLNTFIQESRKVPAHVWKGVAAGWQSANYRSALQSFTKPVLILWGDKDVYCPREDQELLHQAFRQSRMIIYEGIGHALQWENPQRFANDLTDFINSIH